MTRIGSSAGAATGTTPAAFPATCLCTVSPVMIKSIGLKFPRPGVGTGGKWQFRDSKAEIPDTFNILLDYPEGLTVQLVSSMANETPIDHLIRGHKATLEFTRTGFQITARRACSRMK